MLRKVLMAGAVFCAVGAMAIMAYDDASAQQRRGGVARGGGGGGARAPATRMRGTATRRPSRVGRARVPPSRPVHRRSGSPANVHSRRLSPANVHSRRLSPTNVHRRAGSPGVHSRRLSPSNQHRRFGSPGHRRAVSFRPNHWRVGSRGSHRRAWSWHARASSWRPGGPVYVAPVPGGPGPAPAAGGAPAPCNCTCLMTIYKGENLTGENREAKVEEPDLGQAWDDQIASIYVSRGNWEIFLDMNYQGEVMRLAPGPYLVLGPQWTRAISSLRCVP